MTKRWSGDAFHLSLRIFPVSIFKDREAGRKEAERWCTFDIKMSRM